jgi:hypothetical protein
MLRRTEHDAILRKQDSSTAFGKSNQSTTTNLVNDNNRI